MTGDPLRKMAPRQRFAPSASTHNAIMDAVAWVNSQRSKTRAGGLYDTARDGQVLVRNDSGEDRDRFEILTLTDALVLPSENEDEFHNRIGFIGAQPASTHIGRFAVLAAPLKSEAIGFAWVHGVCPAWIKGEGERVDIEEGETGWLLAQQGGSARVLWSEAGDGERWALIRLSDEGPGGVRWGKANGDWTEFSELEVTVWTGTPGGTGEETEEVVDCISPGTDGEGMEGVIGLIIPVGGYGPEIHHQFVPLQCGPTGSGSE